MDIKEMFEEFTEHMTDAEKERFFYILEFICE